jgi:PAS domain S-box-containing protein
VVYGEVERAKLLADVSRALDARVNDLDETLRVVAERVADALGDTCTLYLVSEDRAWLEPVAHHARDPAHRAFLRASRLSDRRLRLDGNPLADVVRSGATHFVPQLPAGALRGLLAPEDRDVADGFDLHGLMTAALRARSEVIGTISVARLDSATPPYAESDRLLLEELAGRAAVVIDNARLYRDTQDTAQKLAISEARLRAMFDSTRIGIVGRDADSRVVECNRAYAHMFGYEPDELIGTELAMLMPDSDDVYREMFAGLTDHVELERSYRRRDGGTLHAHISASLVRDEHGRVVYSLGIVEDQSERRDLERQLVQAQRMEAIGRLRAGSRTTSTTS